LSLRHVIAACALLCSVAAEARDRSTGARDRRCDPDRPTNSAAIDACAPYAYNPAPTPAPTDPRAASELALPLDPPQVRSVLTPRTRP
jgi:hypothetical protein